MANDGFRTGRGEWALKFDPATVFRVSARAPRKDEFYESPLPTSGDSASRSSSLSDFSPRRAGTPAVRGGVASGLPGQSVADAVDGQKNTVWVGGIAQFSTQLNDDLVERPGGAVVPVSPDLIQELVAGQHLAGPGVE